VIDGPQLTRLRVSHVAIADVAKPLSVVNTGGKWNTFEIGARGRGAS
jgi:hypothetical protein